MAEQLRSPGIQTSYERSSGGSIINANTLKLHALTKVIEFGNLQIHKFEGNADINTIELNDIVQGIIKSAGIRYRIEAQYQTAIDPTDFGTVGGNFNDGNYKTLQFQNIEP